MPRVCRSWPRLVVVLVVGRAKVVSPGARHKQFGHPLAQRKNGRLTGALRWPVLHSILWWGHQQQAGRFTENMAVVSNHWDHCINSVFSLWLMHYYVIHVFHEVSCDSSGSIGKNHIHPNIPRFQAGFLRAFGLVCHCLARKSPYLGASVDQNVAICLVCLNSLEEQLKGIRLPTTVELEVMSEIFPWLRAQVHPCWSPTNFVSSQGLCPLRGDLRCSLCSGCGVSDPSLFPHGCFTTGLFFWGKYHAYVVETEMLYEVIFVTVGASRPFWAQCHGNLLHWGWLPHLPLKPTQVIFSPAVGQFHCTSTFRSIVHFIKVLIDISASSGFHDFIIFSSHILPWCFQSGTSTFLQVKSCQRSWYKGPMVTTSTLSKDNMMEMFNILNPLHWMVAVLSSFFNTWCKNITLEDGCQPHLESFEWQVLGKPGTWNIASDHCLVSGHRTMKTWEFHWQMRLGFFHPRWDGWAWEKPRWFLWLEQMHFSISKLKRSQKKRCQKKQQQRHVPSLSIISIMIIYHTWLFSKLSTSTFTFFAVAFQGSKIEVLPRAQR